MAADGPVSLTGVHKRLLTDYVVLELVAHAATWAETEGGENYDEEVALEWGVGCARAYASANLTTTIHDAARKASAFARKHHEALSDSAVVHMMEGRGAEQLRAAFTDSFHAQYGTHLVWLPAELAPPLKAPRKAPAKSIHERAQAIVDRLCEVPLVPDALRPLLSLLGSDCLRQCLPELPPAEASLRAQCGVIFCATRVHIRRVTGCSSACARQQGLRLMGLHAGLWQQRCR